MVTRLVPSKTTAKEGLQSLRMTAACEIDQPCWNGIRYLDEEYAQARIPRRYDSHGAVDTTCGADRTACAEREDRTPSARSGDDAAYPFPTAVVQPIRSGHGRSAV